MKRILTALALFISLCPSMAIADFNATAGSGLVIFGFTCFSTKVCTAWVPINSAGTELFTGANPGIATGSGTAGTAATGVLTVQGIASMTPLIVTNSGTFAVQAAQSGTWNITNVSGTVSLPTGAATAANQTSELTKLDSIITNTGAPAPAGEFHIGEIGSNQIKVQVAQTVTAASAYTAGNAIGGKMTIAGAARVSGALGAAGTGGILTGMQMNSKSLQTTQVDVFLFDADPAGSTCTDKTAFVLATADFDKVVGILTIPGTAANGAGWFGGGTGSVGIPSYLPVTYDLSSATSLFACAVTRGTPTFTATTDVSFKYNFLRN